MGTVLILIIIAIIGAIVVSYNSLQKLAQNVKESASNVQVAISKKMSLINQLIDVVKGYQESEQFTMLKISQDNSASTLMASYQQSGAVLSTIQGMADRFPNLKASGQYQMLMGSISDCELNIQKNREFYNRQVKEYNTKRSGIPTVFVAGPLGFSEAPYLQFDLVGNDVSSLKEFKTDDGERLKQMLRGAGTGIAGAAKSLSSHAMDAGKMLSNKISSKPADTFYYVTPNGVPKGPKPLNEIQKMVDEGMLSPETKVALAGSDDWTEIDSYGAAG